MKLADLNPETLQKFADWRWDGILEKHEGPFLWKNTLSYRDLEFMQIAGRSVLLPVSQNRHQNISLLRCDVRADGDSLTLFLKDTTFCDDSHEDLFCGYVAVCDKIKGEEFYVAILYHEWYILSENRNEC